MAVSARAVVDGARIILVRSFALFLVGNVHHLLPYPADMLWFVAYLYAVTAHLFVCGHDVWAKRREWRAARRLAA